MSSIKDLYYKLYGYVGAPFPEGINASSFAPSNPLGLLKAYGESFKKSVLGVDMIMPLTIEIPAVKVTDLRTAPWELKTEPMISIRGSNRLIRRYPKHAKTGGSIKERWNSDDYTITIKGVIVNFDADAYPEKEVAQLRGVCESKKSLKVQNELLRMFGISRMQIDDFDIPYTEGLNMQSFTIKAYSDKLFNSLLVEA